CYRADLTSSCTLSLHDALPISPDEVLRLCQFEGGAFGLEREGMDTAVGATAAEVHQKEMVLELSRQSGARKIGRPRRSRGDIGKDRKSTRLNSSHQIISYAVFC